MKLYTERHGMRTPIEKTEVISSEMYDLLFGCCEKYFDNVAWKYPEDCPDGYGCCGISLQKLHTTLKFRIPNLHKDSFGEFDQFSLLDFIEFIAQEMRDIFRRNYHSYYRHDDLSFADSSDIFDEFQTEINGIFDMTGLLYTLNSDRVVERKIEHGVVTGEIETVVQSVPEIGTKHLLEEALALFKHHNPAMRKTAVEKLWDAFERLKTYHTDRDKKVSAEKIIADMSGGNEIFQKQFRKEFMELTSIGNDYRIRHHETNTTDITDMRHYDYFFNRCLALIALGVQYLPVGDDTNTEDEEMPF